MTKDEIIEMARQAGIRDCICNGKWGCLERFAKLVTAKEIEACAQSIEKIETYEKVEKACFKFAAKTIRARKE